jgi:hypothetical protein
MKTGKILTRDDNKENVWQQHKEKLNDVLLESVLFLAGGKEEIINTAKSEKGKTGLQRQAQKQK